jgi:predicted Fe-Mo cluster-binding NifX family protein
MKCAFAVTNENIFSEQHFGEAEYFLIYEWKNDTFRFSEKLINPHRQLKENFNREASEKGKAIINLLRKKDVNILVSKQFGPNLSVVNQHFVPVIISDNQPHKVIAVLEKHMSWIEDEFYNKNGDYMLFRIKYGVLKSQIGTAK